MCYNFRSKIIRLKTRIQRNMFRHKLYLWLFVLWLIVCILKWRFSSKIISNILVINSSFKIYLNFWALMQGLLYRCRWTEHSADFFLKKLPLGEGKRSPKLHPRGGFFGPWSFTILKNSHQDLSNEGSNFILSSLEVGHWAAQTQPFLTNFLELQILV